jgi:DNA polymerase III epsilon subunit family exonuclease
MDKNNTYYQPDYHLLNRKAKRCPANGSNMQGKELLEKIFPGSKKAEPSKADPEILEQLSAAITEIKQSIDWEQDLFSASYVAFDTETTGLHPYKDDEIISIGAVIIENNTILNKPVYYQLVNPRRSVSAQSQKITGITDDMLRGKPELSGILLDFLDFTGPRILVAHNASFDLAFINNKVSELIGRRIVNPVIDTVLLASALYYSFGDYSLESLAARFKLDLAGRHNALADARIAASLFLKLLPELKTRGITNLHQLAQFFSDLDLTKGYPLIF